MNAKLLQTFPNPAPQRDYVIEHTHSDKVASIE
jgi:hypothetical protein